MKKFMIAAVALMSAVMVTFAVNVDKTGTGGNTGYPPFGPGVHLFQRTIDFSDTTVTTGTSSYVFQLLDIPAGTKILSVGYEILENSAGTTGEDSTCTIDIGDGSDPDGWIDGANVLTGQTAIAWSGYTFGATSYAMVTGITEVSSSVVTGLTSTTGTWDGTNVVTGITLLYGTNLTAATALTSTVYPTTTVPTGYGNGKFYTTTDSIDLTLNNAADTLKIRLNAIGIGAKKDW